MRPVPAATEKCPIRTEKFPRSDIEPGALVRTGVHIAEVVIRSSPDDDDRKRPAFVGFHDPR
jgi:hypothetical protein